MASHHPVSWKGAKKRRSRTGAATGIWEGVCRGWWAASQLFCGWVAVNFIHGKNGQRLALMMMMMMIHSQQARTEKGKGREGWAEEIYWSAAHVQLWTAAAGEPLQHVIGRQQ